MKIIETTTATPRTHAAASAAAMESAEDTRLELMPPGGAVKVANPLLVRRVRELLGKQIPGATGKWSRGTLARATGSNFSYVSTWLAQYDDQDQPAKNAPPLTMDLVTFEGTIEAFLTQVSERRVQKVDLFETAVSRQFARFAKTVVASRMWGVFHGPGGDGKTSAMLAYCARNPLAIMVTCSKWAASYGAVREHLFRSLNKDGRYRGDRSEIEWLISKLKGSEHVLLFDNFHRMAMGAFNFLADLRDATNVPIIMAGNPAGLAKAKRDEQLATRIMDSEAVSFGREGRERTEALREAAQRLLLRDAPDYADVLLAEALPVVRERGSMRALQGHVQRMNAYMGKTGDTDAVAAFRAARSDLQRAGYVDE